MSEQPSCIICQQPHCAESAFQPADYEYRVLPIRPLRIYGCSSCGSQFIFPRPSVEEVISFYPDDYHAYHDDHGFVARILVKCRSAWRARQYMALIKERPIRLFDVGTGDCRHFDDLAERGSFQFGGVEIKPEMAARARARGYDVITGTLESLDVKAHEEEYHLVTMYQLAEHVPDPIMLFRKAWTLLKPGGYVLGQLPCKDSWERRLFGRYWAGYHYPRHLQMFTKKALAQLLKGSGFSSISLQSALHLQAGLSLQNVVVGKLEHRTRMIHGKVPYYSALLLAVAPFCLLEYSCGRAGMINFRARKPFRESRRDENPSWQETGPEDTE